MKKTSKKKLCNCDEQLTRYAIMCLAVQCSHMVGSDFIKYLERLFQKDKKRLK